MNPTGQLPILMSERMAADYLEVSIDTIQRIRKRHDITFRKIGGRYRYTVKDLMEYIEAQKEEAWPKNESAKSEASGSPSASAPRTGILRGSIPTPDKRAVAALAKATFARRN